MTLWGTEVSSGASTTILIEYPDANGPQTLA